METKDQKVILTTPLIETKSPSKKKKDKKGKEEVTDNSANTFGIAPIDDEIKHLLKKDHKEHETLLIDTTQVMKEEALVELKAQMQKQVFTRLQLQLMYDAFDSNYFTVKQIEFLIKDFPYYQMKNEAVVRAFPKLVDKEKFKTLLEDQVFSDLERRVIIEKLEHNVTY